MVINEINGQCEKDKMKEFFSIQELAERWGYEERTVRNWIVVQKRMPYTRFSRKVKVHFRDALQFETEHRIEANA